MYSNKEEIALGRSYGKNKQTNCIVIPKKKKSFKSSREMRYSSSINIQQLYENFNRKLL